MGLIAFLGELKPSDWVIVFATLAGPVLAVQAQKWVEGVKSQRQAKRQIFATVMATRAARLAPDHVRALNVIDVVYYGSSVFWWNYRTRSERAVLDAWHGYNDALNEAEPEPPANTQLFARREELFLDLLAAMAADTGYPFDRVYLRRGGYHPQGHANVEFQQQALRIATLGVLTGREALKFEVVKTPDNPSGAELQKLLTNALSGGGALHVTIKSEEPPAAS